MALRNAFEDLATDATLEAVRALIASIVRLEDSAHASGEAGIPVFGIRADTDAPTAGSDGDYTLVKLDEEGRVKVSSKPASYPDVVGDITAIQATIGTPVANATVIADVSRASNVMMFCTGTFAGVNCTFEGSLEATGENWFGIQAVRTNANTIETTTGALSTAPAYAWELSVNALARVRVRCTARTSGTQTWRIKLGTYATEPIPAAQVTATQPVSGTVSVGQAAHDAAITGNPVRLAGRALTANYAAVATGDVADLITTLVGALVQKPFSIPEQDWQFAGALTSATAVPARAAQAAGIRNYVTGATFSNSGAAAVDVQILDGVTVVFQATLAAGASIAPTFQTPLRGTAATALNVNLSATGTVRANLQGYSAP